MLITDFKKTLNFEVSIHCRKDGITDVVMCSLNCDLLIMKILTFDSLRLK